MRSDGHEEDADDDDDGGGDNDDDDDDDDSANTIEDKDSLKRTIDHPSISIMALHAEKMMK